MNISEEKIGWRKRASVGGGCGGVRKRRAGDEVSGEGSGARIGEGRADTEQGECGHTERCDRGGYRPQRQREVDNVKGPEPTVGAAGRLGLSRRPRHLRSRRPQPPPEGWDAVPASCTIRR
ncbi:hypothetical protein U1Q18_006897 [Sarracenia purpurea var. burkii]